MKQVRVGDRVRAFLDANIVGEVVEIFHKPSTTMLMVGGVPPFEAYAKIKLDNESFAIVKTTELSVHNV
tara:strand:- start:4131 stop:4337 length:207 start_codon:yes stop_codon:yes gene_type:complete